MTDATLLQKTQSRLLGLKKLKNLAMQTILRNLDALTKKQGGNYMQNKLSPDLRDVVLQELLLRSRCHIETTTTDLYIEKKRILCVLMNTRTEKLDLDYLMSFHPRRMTTKDEFYQVLMMVSIAAPNVRHLKINIKNLVDCFSSDFTRDACIRYLSFLKELRILEIVSRYNDKLDVALLCKALPDLRVLRTKEIDFDVSKMSEEEIRESFGHLSLIEYSWSTGNWYQIWKVLPNLDIVQNVGGNELNLDGFVEDGNHQTRGRKYLNFGTYLRNLNVCAYADFSSIRHLEFTHIGEKWNMFEKILKGANTLESLNLALGIGPEQVDAILLKFGASLRLLSLTGYGFRSVQLNRLSELCPKLEVLHLNRVHTNGNSSQPAKFFHLEEIVCKETDCSNDECLTTFFRSAPNLQKVVLDTWKYNLLDLEQVKNLIIENKILGSLRSLQLEISEFLPEPAYNEISAIVKNAAAHLPELRELKFSYRGVIFSAQRFAKSRPSQYFGNMVRRNPGLYKAIVDGRNLFEVLKHFELNKL